MIATVYEYPKCSTCRKALSFLDKQGIDYNKNNIVETPPSKQELTRMLGYVDGNVKKLFNTSGELYRELKVKDRIASMTQAEAISLLHQHGKLIKRPFILTKNAGAVGFDETVWHTLLKS